MKPRPALSPLLAVLALCVTSLHAQETPAETKAEQTPAPAPSGELEAEDLYDLGKTLFDSFAPEEVKRDYEFPDREQWAVFLPRLRHALEGNSLSELAGLEPEARKALLLLSRFEGTEDLCLWLRERLELIEAARDLTQPPTPRRPVTTPDGVDQLSLAPEIPAYEYWYAKIKQRPAPPAARELMPLLGACFSDEKSPAVLAWLAEVESTFNPEARSPAGAAGLYQLMPATARSLGLSTSWPDERTHPEKSARAAARLLRTLHGKFGDWPLALAAYNAGEGRVRRLLTAGKATTFAGIADALPVETRLYVPKVLATIATRTGVAPAKLR